jgi:peptidyl-prolyl cis-trans isomerase B (cyclophilin B)
MKKAIFVLFAACLLMVSIGCSKDEEAAKTETEDSTLKSPVDSLAAISHPVRNENNPFVTLVTDKGNMTLELYRDVAPIHADSFLARVNDGFYDNLIFHRVLPQFMIQGGDPLGNGTGGAGYYLQAEFSELPHQKGTLSMARSRDPNSASSQFFICLARNAMTKNLDGAYTVFGQLIKGYDVLDAIGKVKCMPNPLNKPEVSRPIEPVYLRSAYKSNAEGTEVM